MKHLSINEQKKLTPGDLVFWGNERTKNEFYHLIFLKHEEDKCFMVLNLDQLKTHSMFYTERMGVFAFFQIV